MSLIPGIGAANAIASFVAKEPVWSLRVIDDGWTGTKEIKGQTRPESLRTRYRTNVVSTDGLNDYSPLKLPTGGIMDAISFTATFRSTHDYLTGGAQVDVRPIRDALLSYWKRDNGLGRPPLLRWSYAGEEHDCWLVGLEPSYPDGLWAIGGNPVCMAFAIELEPAGEHDLEVVDPSAPQKETIYHTLGQGESPESLGLLYHGDPLMGVLISQNNRDTTWMDPGYKAKVLSSDHTKMRVPIRPRGIAFRTAAGMKRLDDLAQMRLDDAGIPWEGQPADMRTL